MNRPFDAARYAGLLEGLEATVIPYSQIGTELRIEPEFFKKRYLHEASALAHLPQRRIGEFATVTDGPHGYHVVDEASRIVMLTAKNGKHWFSDREGADPIAAWVDTNNRRSSLGANDIILSTRGTVGLCALVTEETLPANIDQDVARISWKDKLAIRPEYVAAYLNSSFGQDHIERYASGMVQQGLSLQKVREIPIPVLSTKVQNAITSVVESALAHRRSAKNQLQAAEHNLLLTLGLADWRAPQPLSYIRTSRDAFAAGRLDAEYFKPGCTELEAHLRATGSACTLRSLLTINERGTQPDYADAGLPVVNSKHVVNNEVRLDDENRTARHGARMLKIRQGDVLMNGTGVGTIGRAAPYLHVSEALPDNHVTVLRPKTGAIDPVYLAVFLNSLAGKLQVEKRLRGSSGQIELYPNDIAQFLVWQAPNEVQLSIRRSVETAFAAKQRAAALLDAAKRAVEIAIENSEAVALAWLQDARARAEGAP